MLKLEGSGESPAQKCLWFLIFLFDYGLILRCKRGGIFFFVWFRSVFLVRCWASNVGILRFRGRGIFLFG